MSSLAAPAIEPEGAGVRVWTLSPADRSRWDRFVEACPEATFFHRAGWRDVIENVFEHPTYYLYAESAQGIEGVLPLGHIRSRLFGNALISSPFCVYGGVAARTEGARRALEEEAEHLAKSLEVDYLEMRHRVRRRDDWPSKDLYVTFRKEMHPDPDENLKAIPRKQRAMVRKGIQAGLESTIDAETDRLYEAYATSVRNLGTPVYTPRFFAALKEAFGSDCEISTITKAGRLLSSVMTFYFRDEVLPYYGGGTAEARAYKANDFMYWDVMKRATERGVRVFDYGRSKVGTGSYSFKKNWGFEPEPLPYQYCLVRAGEVPNVSPANPKYRLLVEAWRRLPLSVSKWVGPLVSRNLV